MDKNKYGAKTKIKKFLKENKREIIGIILVSLYFVHLFYYLNLYEF